MASPNLRGTALYAGSLSAVFVGLAYNVIRLRRAKQISVGDGGDKELQYAIAAHANFCQYAPSGLLLLLIVESTKITPQPFVHVVGALLLAGRILHAYAFVTVPHSFKLRIMGMMGTFWSHALAAGACLLYGAGVL